MDTQPLVFAFFPWLMEQGIVVLHSSKTVYVRVFATVLSRWKFKAYCLKVDTQENRQTKNTADVYL